MPTIIVTGANRGLGAAIARTFRGAGWRVLGTARDPSRIDADTVDEAHALDLSEAASVAAFAGAVREAVRPVDLVVNNAGFNPKDRRDDPDYFRSTFAIEAFSAANVAETLWINALMPTELVSRLLPALADDAVVLNISSWLGSIGGKSAGGHYGYAGSKALLNMFTRAMALEFERLDGTRRSAVALNPGWMRTDMGGTKAEVTPDHVAARILAMHTDRTLHGANGRFVNTDGSTHEW